MSKFNHEKLAELYENGIPQPAAELASQLLDQLVASKRKAPQR